MHENCDDLAPRKAHADDAAYDVRARVDALIRPGDVMLVPTGLYLELPCGYEAQIRPRSGNALKKAVTVLNSPGTIDAGYRGEVGVIVYNAGREDFRVERGDRIAQMVVQSLPEIELLQADELADSRRGDGGFGSTGTQ
jgi:dUTP pyrophosphatase